MTVPTSFTVQHHVDLSHMNTMRLQAIADTLVTVSSTAAALEYVQQYANSALWVLGGGSNVLLATTLQTAVLKPAIYGIEVLHQDVNTVDVAVGAGEIWHTFVMHTVQQSWYGLENLSLIPGSVGACPVQNIGAYGVEVKDRILWVEAIDTHTATRVVLPNVDCHFAYRDSVFKQHAGRYIITRVAFRLMRQPCFQLSYGDVAQQVGEQPTLQRVADTIIRIRQQKLPDPAVLPNCGSYFKNPIVPTSQAQQLQAQYPQLPCYAAALGYTKVAAGWLIEHAGFKGKRMGAMGVYDKQALVMVNYEHAKLQDVLALEHAIQAAVYHQFQVQLEREPVMMC